MFYEKSCSFSYFYYKSTTVIPAPPNCICSSWKCFTTGRVERYCLTNCLSMPFPVPCSILTRLIPTRIASSMKYITALMASSPLIPLMSMSCRNDSLRSSIVSRVLRLITGTTMCASFFLSIVACSNLSARILVRISPKITVAILPSKDSTLPILSRPFILTVSPMAMTLMSALALLLRELLSAAEVFCVFLALRSCFLFSFLSLRAWICLILRSIISSFAVESMSLISSLKDVNSSLILFVSSFSACASLISFITFSILLLLSLSSSSACSFAFFMTSLRFFANSFISFSYFEIISSICFSLRWMFRRLFSQYLLSLTMSCKYLSLCM